MKNLSDEEIQARLDNELSPIGDMLYDQQKQQMEGYQYLFQNLNVEPKQGLPFNFASRVTSQLKLKLKRRSDIWFNLFALLGIIVGLFIFYGLLTVIDFNAGNQFLMSMLKLKWLLMLGALILLSSLIIEQRVIEKS